MAHAISHTGLQGEVDQAVRIISRDRARKKTFAVGALLIGVLGLLGATYAMYTYTPGKIPAGQV
ncbi:MAG TPA: hypothetical protein VHW01_17705, partial [Polyangiaceae bacterium]|nr:hypothetical protein [Polyangiaceae bacterium]